LGYNKDDKFSETNGSKTGYIDSFYHHVEGQSVFEIPLGNVTSQVFANIYLHELDLFVKHQLKAP